MWHDTDLSLLKGYKFRAYALNFATFTDVSMWSIFVLLSETWINIKIPSSKVTVEVCSVVLKKKEEFIYYQWTNQFRPPELLRWPRARVFVRRRPSSSFHGILGQTQSNLVCSIFRTRRQEIVNFMTPTPRKDNLGVKSVRLM